MLQVQPFKSLKQWDERTRADAIALEWQELIDLAQTTDQKVYIIDTETTGFTNADTVIEIALIDLATGKLVFHRYYMPVKDSHPSALKVHGLSKNKLARLKAVEWDVISAKEIENFLEGAIVLEYSTGFDERMINLSLDHAYSSIGSLTDCQWRSPMLDYNIYRGVLNGTGKGFKRHKLIDACKSMGLEWDSAAAHGAVYDAEMVYKLMQAIVNRVVS